MPTPKFKNWSCLELLTSGANHARPVGLYFFVARRNAVELGRTKICGCLCVGAIFAQQQQNNCHHMTIMQQTTKLLAKESWCQTTEWTKTQLCQYIFELVSCGETTDHALVQSDATSKERFQSCERTASLGLTQKLRPNTQAKEARGRRVDGLVNQRLISILFSFTTSRRAAWHNIDLLTHPDNLFPGVARNKDRRKLTNLFSCFYSPNNTHFLHFFQSRRIPRYLSLSSCSTRWKRLIVQAQIQKTSFQPMFCSDKVMSMHFHSERLLPWRTFRPARPFHCNLFEQEQITSCTFVTKPKLHAR